MVKRRKIDIGRCQSGSHLVTCLLANQHRWKQSGLHFIVNHNFDNLRKSVGDQTIAAFIRKYSMQKPFYDKGKIRRIGGNRHTLALFYDCFDKKFHFSPFE